MPRPWSRLLIIPTSSLLLGATMAPLLGAQEDSACTAGSVEIHTWVPATLTIEPDGTEVRRPGYWQVTRRPLTTEAVSPDPTGCEPSCEVAPSSVVDLAPETCAPTVAINLQAEGAREPRPRWVIAPPPVEVPHHDGHGFWHAIAAPWRAGMDGHGGLGHGPWSLQRVPMSILSPLRLLGHLR